jgi:hypothetical protein
VNSEVAGLAPGVAYLYAWKDFTVTHDLRVMQPLPLRISLPLRIAITHCHYAWNDFNATHALRVNSDYVFSVLFRQRRTDLDSAIWPV